MNAIPIQDAADRAIRWLDSISDEELIAELEKHSQGPLSYAFSWGEEDEPYYSCVTALKFRLNDTTSLRNLIAFEFQISLPITEVMEKLPSNDDQYLLAA